MTIEKFHGSPPSASELSAAPIVERWMLLPIDGSHHDISGFVTGHPKFPAGHFVTTSIVMQIDLTQTPTWMRSVNRVYRLGQPAGAVESQVREIARDVGARPRTWDVVAYTKILDELAGHPQPDIDVIEMFIAVLYSHGHFTTMAAKTLLITYRKERTAC